MRILWLSHLIPYPPKGGVQQRAYHLLHETAKYHEVDLLAFHQPNAMRPSFPNLEEGTREAENVLGKFCNHVNFVAIESENQFLGLYRLAIKSLLTKDPYNINWLKSAEYAKNLQQLLKKNDYDLVHVDTISLIPYFKYVQHLPTVLDHHNIESHMLLRRADNETNCMKRWYFRQEGQRLEKIEKQICPQFLLNITCSQIDKKRLQSLSPTSWTKVIPNGVDTDYFKQNTTVKQERSLVFIGTLHMYWNIEAVKFIAYNLWPALKEIIPDIKIDIIGPNPPEDIVLLSKKDNDFKVHGFVDDILPFIDRASIYICPIMDGGGTKLKVLDALSMSKALVAHRIACEGICVQDGKSVIFAQSVDEYVAAITSLIDDETLRRTMGSEARTLAEEKYSYEIIGKNLSALYERCLTPKN